MGKQEIEAYRTNTEILTEDSYINDAITEFTYKFKSIDVSRASGFQALLKYINKNIDIKKNDIEFLNNLWDNYILICSACSLKPTMQAFAILTGIHPGTFTDWIDNARHSEKVGSLFSESAKRWKNECENALLIDTTERNSIGSMFALKANYGYRDNVVINVNADNNRLGDTLSMDDIQKALPKTDNVQQDNSDIDAL